MLTSGCLCIKNLEVQDTKSFALFGTLLSTVPVVVAGTAYTSVFSL